MGYWSVLSSVDDMEGRTLLLPMVGAAAVEAVERAVQRPDRVLCERTADGALIARTIKYTPAWAYLGPLLLLIIRRTRVANFTFAGHAHGTALTVHGRLDTRSAEALRSMAGPRRAALDP
ncbi:MAG: hypothetical protein ACT4P1_15305 [Sporichthyaceae bacterium]